MEEETPKTEIKKEERTDVFLWANNLVPIKEELDIDLFLFNKNYVVYRTKVSKELVQSFQPLLIDGLLEAVLSGAGEGLVVRDFEDGESEDLVLQRVHMSKVHKAEELLSWVKSQESVIETFVEAEHDLKRIKGIVARCKHPDLKTPFYIVKSMPGSQIMKGSSSWELKDGKFTRFESEGAVRIPSDNQLLILEKDIYAFNPTRLEQLFGYNAKKYSIALAKMQEIQANFTFNFDTGLSWENLVEGQKTMVNKLQKLDTEGINQKELMDHAEELGLDLMTDSDGAIIIMGPKDLSKFINLLNEDYMESPLTGKKYEIKSKKPLKIKSDSESDEVLS